MRFSLDEVADDEDASPEPLTLAYVAAPTGAGLSTLGSALPQERIENYNTFIFKLRQLLLGADEKPGSDKTSPSPKSPIDKKHQIETLFKRIDSDGSGKLSRVEFSNFISSEELGLFQLVEHKSDYDSSPKHQSGLLQVTVEDRRNLIKMIIEQIDNNNDGYISFKELEDFLSVDPSASMGKTSVIESGMLYSIVRSAIRELLVSNGYDIFSDSKDNNVLQMLASLTNDLSKVRGGQSIDKKVFVRLLLTLDIPKLNRGNNNKLTNNEAVTVANHLDHSNKGIVTASDLKKWILRSLTAREKSKILVPLLVFIHEHYDDKIEDFFSALNIQADISNKIYSADFIDRLKVLGVKCKDYDQLFGACLYTNSNDHWITLESIEDSVTSAREYVDVKEYTAVTPTVTKTSTPISVDTFITYSNCDTGSKVSSKEVISEEEDSVDISCEEKDSVDISCEEEDSVDISCSVEKKGVGKVWRPSSKKPYLAASVQNDKIHRQKLQDDPNNSTSPIRRRDGKLIHLGGGAAGMGVKQLVNKGYRFHTGKWKGWPFDYWDCCRSRDKVCPNFVKKHVKIPIKDIIENQNLPKGEESFIDKTLEREQRSLYSRRQEKNVCFVLSKESLPIDKGLGHTGPISLYESVTRPLEYNGKAFESVAYIKDKQHNTREEMAVKYFVSPQVAPPTPPVIKLFKFEKSQQKEGEVDTSSGKPIIYPFEINENSKVYIDLRKLDSMIEQVDEVLDNRPLPPKVKDSTNKIIMNNKRRKEIIHEIATNIRSEYDVKSQALLGKIVETFEKKVTNINDRIKNQDELLLVELEKIKAANINIVIDNEKHHQMYRHLVGKIEKRIGELLVKSRAQDNYILDETKSQRRALITMQQEFNDYRLDNSSKLVTAIRKVIVEELGNKSKKVKTWRPAGNVTTPSSNKEPTTPAGVWRPVSRKQYTPRPSKESYVRTPRDSIKTPPTLSREAPSKDSKVPSKESPSGVTPYKGPSSVVLSKELSVVTPGGVNHNKVRVPTKVKISTEKVIETAEKHTSNKTEDYCTNIDTKYEIKELDDDMAWDSRFTANKKRTIKLSIEDKESWLGKIKDKVNSIIMT